MNYAELSELIQQYVESDETSFVENIPNFVKLAEERIHRYVRVPNQRATSTLAFTTGNPDAALPADFIEPESLTVTVSGVISHLVPKEFTFLTEAYPTAAGTGTPAYYAVFDNDTLRVAPAPSGNMNLSLTYTKKPASIVDASTNWIGDNAEQALLYGSLVEAYTYLKGEQDILALYEGRFMEAVGQAKMVGDTKVRTDEWRNVPPYGGM